VLRTQSRAGSLPQWNADPVGASLLAKTVYRSEKNLDSNYAKPGAWTLLGV